MSHKPSRASRWVRVRRLVGRLGGGGTGDRLLLWETRKRCGRPARVRVGRLLTSGPRTPSGVYQERQPPRSVLTCSAAFCALAVASAALAPELIIFGQRLRDHELPGYGPGQFALTLRNAPPLERVWAFAIALSVPAE